MIYLTSRKSARIPSPRIFQGIKKFTVLGCCAFPADGFWEDFQEGFRCLYSLEVLELENKNGLPIFGVQAILCFMLDIVGFGVNAIDQVIQLYRIPTADA